MNSSLTIKIIIIIITLYYPEIFPSPFFFSLFASMSPFLASFHYCYYFLLLAIDYFWCSFLTIMQSYPDKFQLASFKPNNTTKKLHQKKTTTKHHVHPSFFYCYILFYYFYLTQVLFCYELLIITRVGYAFSATCK